MADIVDSKTRSRMMSGIRDKNTKPELIVRRFLYSEGFRYSLHSKKLPGKPDIVLTKYRTIVFVNGCFWHRCPHCHRAYMPKSNKGFWKKKLEGNRLRDMKKKRELRALNWQVLTIWECQTADIKKLNALAVKIRGRK